MTGTGHRGTKRSKCFTLLPESPQLYAQWRKLVTTHAVSGKKVHDTRLVAAMLVHGVTYLLTFNVQDFIRIPKFEPYSQRMSSQTPEAELTVSGFSLPLSLLPVVVPGHQWIGRWTN